MNEKEIEVHQMRDDKEISVENLKWPQKYEDFIKEYGIYYIWQIWS